MNTVLELKNVDYYYPTKATNIDILKDASFFFEQGKLYSIIGPSGSGKTTTLSLLGALETPKRGSILYKERDIQVIGMSRYRKDHLGFVFQAYNLLTYLSAVQNVLVAMGISGSAEGEDKAAALLKSTGLDASLFNRKPNYLSGGEQQRVAIARAISTGADIIIADEPTGNLDKATALDIVGLFNDLAHKEGKCVIVATHSDYFHSIADSIVTLENKMLKVV